MNKLFTTKINIKYINQLHKKIVAQNDQIKLGNFFAKYNEDLLYIDTPEEQRKCIVVTQELYDAGLTWCIDQWVKPDENGEYEITELEVGDVLIVDTGVYCCRKNVFAKTYKF